MYVCRATIIYTSGTRPPRFAAPHPQQLPLRGRERHQRQAPAACSRTSRLSFPTAGVFARIIQVGEWPLGTPPTSRTSSSSTGRRSLLVLSRKVYNSSGAARRPPAQDLPRRGRHRDRLQRGAGHGLLVHSTCGPHSVAGVRYAVSRLVAVGDPPTGARPSGLTETHCRLHREHAWHDQQMVRLEFFPRRLEYLDGRRDTRSREGQVFIGYYKNESAAAGAADGSRRSTLGDLQETVPDHLAGRRR